MMQLKAVTTNTDYLHKPYFHIGVKDKIKTNHLKEISARRITMENISSLFMSLYSCQKFQLLSIAFTDLHHTTKSPCTSRSLFIISIQKYVVLCHRHP